MKKEKLSEADQLVLKKASRKTIIAFSVLFSFFAGLILLWIYIQHQSADNGTPKVLRSVLNFNESVFSPFFRQQHPAPEFTKEDAVKKVRVNGRYGMSEGFNMEDWKLKVVRISKEGKEDTLFISLDEIKKLPKIDIIFNFKCIEGWSQVTWWGGVKLSAFLKYYHLGEKEDHTKYNYMGLETPDHEYYVGIDMASCLHPQTILCYEMNGQPLPMEQGAPLRLIIPVKYGIKHLKRIGAMYFSDEKPKDYWFERGYDYYSGL